MGKGYTVVKLLANHRPSFIPSLRITRLRIHATPVVYRFTSCFGWFWALWLQVSTSCWEFVRLLESYYQQEIRLGNQQLKSTSFARYSSTSSLVMVHVSDWKSRLSTVSGVQDRMCGLARCWLWVTWMIGNCDCFRCQLVDSAILLSARIVNAHTCSDDISNVNGNFIRHGCHRSQIWGWFVVSWSSLHQLFFYSHDGKGSLAWKLPIVRTKIVPESVFVVHGCLQPNGTKKRSQYSTPCHIYFNPEEVLVKDTLELAFDRSLSIARRCKEHEPQVICIQVESDIEGSASEDRPINQASAFTSDK